VKGGLGSQICQWVQVSAFVMSPFTFDLVWQVLLEKLTSGTDSTKQAANYLMEAAILYRGEDGLYTSDWRSSLSDVEPGFSTLSSNALESHWRVLDLLHSKTQGHEVATQVFEEFRKSFNMGPGPQVTTHTTNTHRPHTATAPRHCHQPVQRISLRQEI